MILLKFRNYLLCYLFNAKINLQQQEEGEHYRSFKAYGLQLIFDLEKILEIIEISF
jgi:hypothetical protein